VTIPQPVDIGTYNSLSQGSMRPVDVSHVRDGFGYDLHSLALVQTKSVKTIP
jgi:hypothetical protein